MNIMLYHNIPYYIPSPRDLAPCFACARERLLGLRPRAACAWAAQLPSRSAHPRARLPQAARLHSPENSRRLPEIFGEVCNDKSSFLQVFVENRFLPSCRKRFRSTPAPPCRRRRCGRRGTTGAAPTTTTNNNNNNNNNNNTTPKLSFL